MQQQYQGPHENSPLPFLILASLVDESKRATTLHEAVIQMSGLLIEPGAFSRILARMERRGWIVGDEGEEGLRRYHITDLGMLALQAHAQSNQKQYERSPDGQRGKERMMPLVFWILRLYPPLWRERYEAEMVALLSQHHITLWTILDLLLGALDARLDPHYRRAHQLLPLRRFKSSWRLLVAGFVLFWFALLPWFWMSQIGLDDANCSDSVWGGNVGLCMMRKTVNVHQPGLAALLVALILIFLPILLMLFMTMLVTARGKQARTHLQLALLATGGMLILCITCGFWLAGIWQLLPQISRFYPQTPAGLFIGIIGMGFATVLAIGAQARASFALKDMEKAAPRQEASIPGAATLSSTLSEHQQADQYAEARAAEESEGQQQEIPRVLRAATPVREPAATSFVAANEAKKAAKGEWALLIGLVLVYIFPWPWFISTDRPDFSMLLFTWLAAAIVGLITAWLVKEPDKKRERHNSRKPQRPTSPLWWAALLPAPVMMFFIFSIVPQGPSGLLLLLPVAIISGATALIVKIRMGSPHLKSPLALGLSIIVAGTIFIVLGVSHAVFAPLRPILFLVTLLCILPAFFVRVPDSKQQGESVSEPQDIGAGAGPKVWGWFLFFLVCNTVYAQVGFQIFNNLSPYQGPPPTWIGPNEEFLVTLAAISLIPAVIAKIRISNRWAQGVRQPESDELSPKIWILVLPIVFLSFCTQWAYILLPDNNSFANVFISWLLTGVAALIILLSIHLGSRPSKGDMNVAPPQAHMQAQ